ncbi:MAG: S-layer homology domain-containing protein [Acidimicrobiales bacterium]
MSSVDLDARSPRHATNRAVAALVTVALAAALLASGAQPAAATVLVTDAQPAAAALSAPADAELEFLQLLNQTRGAHGLGLLKSDALIVPVARDWSGAMAASNTLSHRPDLLSQIESRVTTDWLRIGENVGRGGSVGSLHTAFMNSPSHKANVLGDYNRVGIGVVNAGTTIWVTFNFLKGADINGPTGAVAGPVYDDVATRGIEHACPRASTLLTSFIDVATTAHASSIGCAVSWGVASGQTPLLFAPTGRVTRAQLASFVARMIEAAGTALPASPRDAFSDDDSSIHELRINQLAALGVVTGKSAGRYAPNDVVDRAAMATFLVRAHDVAAAKPLAAGSDAFGDDNGTTHEANINKVAAAGFAGGTRRGVYAPSAAVQRGQMATFLSRTIDLLVASGDTDAR